MNDYSKISIIIPTLHPTGRFEAVVDGLIGAGFNDIIVVDDGSGSEYSAYFERAAQKNECTVLRHEKNRGKGAALKTAYAFFEENRTGQIGVITVDADGQHLTPDIVKCADALLNSGNLVVMGIRDFNNSDVPRRNSLGNRITALALCIIFGLTLHDTQTGLRAIPAAFIPFMSLIEGTRFEYETNMLIEFKNRGIPFLEVKIETVYEEGSNERSNYRPVRDSLRIFSRIIKYAASSITCFLVDISMFSLAMTMLGSYLGGWSIICCTVIARIISSFLNFNINRLVVFKKKSAFSRRILRYYMLVVFLMLLSAFLLWLVALPFSGVQPVGFITLLKVLIDLGLFFLNYFIQRAWVFKQSYK